MSGVVETNKFDLNFVLLSNEWSGAGGHSCFFCFLLQAWRGLFFLSSAPSVFTLLEWMNGFLILNLRRGRFGVSTIMKRDVFPVQLSPQFARHPFPLFTSHLFASFSTTLWEGVHLPVSRSPRATHAHRSHTTPVILYVAFAGVVVDFLHQLSVHLLPTDTAHAPPPLASICLLSSLYFFFLHPSIPQPSFPPFRLPLLARGSLSFVRKSMMYHDLLSLSLSLSVCLAPSGSVAPLYVLA